MTMHALEKYQPTAPISSVTRSERSESSARVRRLRAHRIRVEELKLGEMTATGRHAGLGTLQARVEDLSLAGMALVLHGASSSSAMVLVGDRLERLTVTLGSAVGSVLVHEGNAVVRRISERESDLVIGVELEGRGMDLAELYRLDTQRSFAERMQGVLSASDDVVGTEFKAWVADARAQLEATKAFLDAEERALDGLDRLSREQALGAYLEEAAPVLIERMNQRSSGLASLVSELPDDQHAAHRKYFRAHILPLICESPLLRRAYEKPLGYAGDYEMMNMLYRDHAEGASLFGRVLNMYGAQEPAARANITESRISATRSAPRSKRAAACASPASAADRAASSRRCSRPHPSSARTSRWP